VISFWSWSLRGWACTLEAMMTSGVSRELLVLVALAGEALMGLADHC
jgi:hypothetical protein